MCYAAEFGRSRSNGKSVIKEIRLKNLTHVSRSLKVIGTDTYRSVTYDFLLTFYSNHGPISYRFRDKLISVKNRKYFPPRVFCAPAEGIPLGIGYRRSGSKTRTMRIPGRERSLTLFSAVWIQYTNVTDRRTARRTETPGDSKDRAYTHSIAR